MDIPKLQRVDSNEGGICQIDADLVLKEFNCTICFNPIEECYITRCGHTFCQACVLQVINRMHKCALCQTVLNENDVFQNYHFNNLKKLIVDEKEKASQDYVNKMFSEPKGIQEEKVASSPIELLLQKYLQDIIMTYQKQFNQTEIGFKNKQDKLMFDFNESMKDLLKEQKEDFEIREKFLKEYYDQEFQLIDEQILQVNNFYLQSLERNLKSSAPNPDILQTPITLLIPNQNLRIESMLIKPNSFVRDFRIELQHIFLKNNNPILEIEPKEVLLITYPLVQSKEFNDIFLLNQNLNLEGIKMLIAQVNDPLLTVKTLESPELFITLKITPGSIVVIMGNFQCQSDLPPECITYEFNGNKILDYFTCETCKLNWICPPCQECCHKGHSIVPYLQDHTATWACCYCVSKGQCKALNQLNKKK